MLLDFSCLRYHFKNTLLGVKEIKVQGIQRNFLCPFQPFLSFAPHILLLIIIMNDTPLHKTPQQSMPRPQQPTPRPQQPTPRPQQSTVRPQASTLRPQMPRPLSQMNKPGTSRPIVTPKPVATAAPMQ
jgi:hypothetical protein